MRCAPIGIWARHAEEASMAARDDARLSHPHPVCQAASGIRRGDHDRRKRRRSRGDADGGGNGCARAGGRAVRDRLALSRLGHGPDDFMGEQGWVMIAFHNAFRHLASGTPIEDALVETVGEGGDTDTNAAICGALLGAAIPVRWSMAVLACRPLSETGARQPRPARYWPDDVPLLAEALLARARYSH
jgi:ADP-ribosyl-[dinitrogen reductase] hydrolase